MAINKVIYGGNTLIDLTGDTVAADKLLSGYTAHNKAGVQITGTATAGYRVATGGVKSSSSLAHSVTVSGLSFKPVGVIVACMENPSSNTSMVMGQASFTVAQTSSGNPIYALRRNGSSAFTQITSSGITFNSDGFTLSSSNGTYSSTMAYVAWG